MFEFTLTANAANSTLTDFAFDYLKPKVESYGGIIVKAQVGRACSVSLAVGEKMLDCVRAQILDAVAGAIVRYYKEQFLAQNIAFSCINKAHLSGLIRALVVFDRQTDYDIIKKHLVLENKLVMDSFYVFRLQELRERWNSIASVVMENIPIMLKNKTVEEITKSFVDSTEEAVDTVEIVAKNGKINLLASGKMLDIEFCLNADYQTDLVCELIALSPKKIVICAEPKTAQIIENALSIVFDGKIVKNI
jgi:hypothetical protein